jgi:O-antigen ligase
MNTSTRKASSKAFDLHVGASVHSDASCNYLLACVAPALFALLVSTTIRTHSLAPLATMSQVIVGLAALVIVAFMLLFVKGCRIDLPKSVVLLLIVWFAAATISVFGSGNAQISSLRLALYVLVALFSIVVHLGYRDEETVPLEAYLLGIAVVHLPFLLSAILWITDLEPPFWENGYRVAHFVNVRQFAEFGFFAAVSATGLALLSRRFVVPSFLLASAALFGLILTGSRGACLSWILFTLLACCFSLARLRAAIHGLLVLTLAAVLVWYLDSTGALPSPNIFVRVVSEQAGQEGFDNSRFDLWAHSWRQIAAHPLFGSGPEGYWLSGCCNPRVMQAHNFVLQFLMEFGVVGCGITLLLAVRAVKEFGGVAALFTLTLATPRNRVLACMLASYLAYSLVDQTMYHVLPLLFFALLAGLFAAGLVRARIARAEIPLAREGLSRMYYPRR